MAVPNSSFDQLSAITNDHFMGRMPSLVFDSNPILSMLHKKGTKPSGGDSIRVPLVYAVTQDGAYTDYEKGSTTAEDQVTAAEFPWKLYRQKVIISVPEIARNSGPAGVFKLLKAKMGAAAEAIRDSIAGDMYTPSYGDSDKQVNSLDNLVGNGTHPSGNVTCGGISKLTYTWWRGVCTDFTTNSPGDPGQMIPVWFDVVDGDKHPTAIVSHPDAQDDHITVATNGRMLQERFVNTNELKSGFTTMTFMGQPWYTDRRINDSTSGEASVYMLRMEDIDLVTHKDQNFAWSGFMTPTDQNARIGWIYWMGNLTIQDPRRCALMYT